MGTGCSPLPLVVRECRPHHHTTTLPLMTRLELLHTIQENAETLTLHDAVMLLAGRLPNDAELLTAWDEFAHLVVKHCR